MHTLTRLFTLLLCLGALLGVSSCADDTNVTFEAGDNGANNGVNSSYARLITVGNYLYGINESELITFDATDPTSPDEIARVDVGFGIETIYHLDGNLFVGSQEAMFIYTIQSDGIPQRRSRFEYDFQVTGSEILPCDPIAVSGDVAYVTLYTQRPGRTSCGGTFTQFIERLVVVDIADLDAPQLVESYTVPSPRGLGVDSDNELLFVCNDLAGLTIYNISDRRQPIEIARNETPAYDVIARDGQLIVVAPGRLTQYSYTSGGTLTELGVIILD